MGFPNSKQIKDFIKDLYDFIWKNHRFRSEALERQMAEDLYSMIGNNSRKSQFNEDIGEAVLKSQYLLRELCSHFYSFLKIHLIERESLFVFSVYHSIYEWISYRRSVFYKVIDAAAMIAEAILFCESKSKLHFKLSLAKDMLYYFFVSELSEEFFDKGGWTQFKEEVAQKYNPISLEKFMPPLSQPYGGLNYIHSFIDTMYSFKMFYPVEVSDFIKEGMTVHGIHYGIRFSNEKYMEMMEHVSENGFTEEERSRLGLSARIMSMHWFYGLVCSKEVILRKSENEFRFYLIGHDEVVKDNNENIASNAAEGKSKRNRKRNKRKKR